MPFGLIIPQCEILPLWIARTPFLPWNMDTLSNQDTVKSEIQYHVWSLELVPCYLLFTSCPWNKDTQHFKSGSTLCLEFEHILPFYYVRSFLLQQSVIPQVCSASYLGNNFPTTSSLETLFFLHCWNFTVFSALNVFRYLIHSTFPRNAVYHSIHCLVTAA